MTKALISVTVEISVLEEAHKRNINISQAAEEGIKAACGGKIEGIIHRLSKLERVESKLDEDKRLLFIGRMKIEQVNFCKTIIFKSTGIKLNDEEILELYNKLKEVEK